MSPQLKLEFVNKTEFPPYAITCVGDRYVIVGGGGGSAKTGIKNKFDVFQLVHNGKQTSSRCVLSHDVGEHCISNMVAWTEEPTSSDPTSDTKGYTAPCPVITLALGQEETCMILRLIPKLILDDSDQDDLNKPEMFGVDGDGVRQRGVSGMAASQANNIYYTFNVTHLATFTSVFSRTNGEVSGSSDVYQKACRVSRSGRTLATGGTDGALRLWDLTQAQPSKLQDIAAHAKEVDQLDFSPDGTQVVSVCKGTRECCVWSWKTSKKLAMLPLVGTPVNYKFAWARYGSVENQPTKTRLYTISNPVTGSKHPGIVSQWCGSKFTQQRSQSVAGLLSNLSVTGNGRYLATGTMDGDVIVMVSFSLQVLQRVKNAHSSFVTGVEWLDQHSRTSCIVRGFSDASLLSVSCDNCLMISHVPAVTMMPVWLVAVIAALVLAGTFILASYLGL